MKSLNKIKNEVAIDDNFNSWQILFESCAMYDYGRLEKAISEVAKRYAMEVAKEALKNANSKLRDKDFLFHDDYELAEKSILSESNIPKL